MADRGKPTRLHCPKCGRFIGKVEGTYAELTCKRCGGWYAFKIKPSGESARGNRVSVREAVA